MNKSPIKKHTLALEAIMETDQQAIKDFKAGKISTSDLIEINKKNVDTIKIIISEIGFPLITLTSQKAYKAAVLVVLHSEDFEFLNQSIKFLQNANPISIQRRDIAYMIDKIRLLQKLPQLYGTQYYIDKDGVIKYVDIEKPEELEKRRKEYDMESFEEYQNTVKQSLSNKQL